MFRRGKADEATTTPLATAEAGARSAEQKKGRPTPSRREAEAAARERARSGMDKKQAAAAARSKRTSDQAKYREGLKTGEERYLPPRDKGPVRRFLRDLVDSRFNMAEILLPMLLVIMVLTYTGDDTLVGYGNALWMTTILVVAADTVWLLSKVRRELRTRFPDESHRGAPFYAVLRSLQFRFMRLPKPQRKIGQKP